MGGGSGTRGRDGSYHRTVRPAGTRFKSSPSQSRLSSQASGSHQAPQSHAAAGGHHAILPAHPRGGRCPVKTSPVALILGIVAVVLVAVALFAFIIPGITSLIHPGSDQAVEAGLEVEVNIPDGASGDQIAQILSESHVIDDPKV